MHFFNFFNNGQQQSEHKIKAWLRKERILFLNWSPQTKQHLKHFTTHQKALLHVRKISKGLKLWNFYCPSSLNRSCRPKMQNRLTNETKFLTYFLTNLWLMCPIWRLSYIFSISLNAKWRCIIRFCLCLLPVICPYPKTNPGRNDTSSLLVLDKMGNFSDADSFDHYWSKTNTVPLYLIVLLLPLLCFRSASFFARFTFFGKVLDFFYIFLAHSVGLLHGEHHNLTCSLKMVKPDFFGIHFGLACLLRPGTISVIYLIVLVSIKAAHLGFHLEFHWLDASQFYVPGNFTFHDMKSFAWSLFALKSRVCSWYCFKDVLWAYGT